MLLKKYTNEIFEIIKKKGYNVNDFKIENFKDEENRLDIFGLIYDSNMKFFISNSIKSFNTFKVQYTIFEKTYPLTGLLPKNFVDFKTVIAHFNSWTNAQLGKYIEEIDRVDLWQSVSENIDILNISPIDLNNNNVPFNDGDKEQLIVVLDKIVPRLMKEFSFDVNQLARIENTVNALHMTLEIMNKKAWQANAQGALIGLLVTLSVDKHTGHQIWLTLCDIFQAIPILIGF
jgi:hypothetical protein